jgi:glycolate oxidase
VALPAAFVSELEAGLPQAALIREPEQLKVYECDGLTAHRAVPALVVLPESTEQVQAAVRACHRHGVPFVARGAGTGLSGGARPDTDGIVISFSRMTRVLDVNLEGRRVVVQPGVTNLQVTEAVAGDGLYYAHDP